MKKIYLFACATLLAFSSCTNEISEDGFVDKTNAISFSAYPTRTRAAIAGDVTTKNMKDDNFGVVGYTCNDNNIYLFKKVGDDNKAVEQTYVPGSGSSSGTWEYANKGDLKFWPNQNMDFYAYFPYSDNATFENNNNPSDGEDLVMTIPSV
ncbi:MAG: fimbrillin family protein, partial [Bacteroidaceae bacterium]|nr:fimbrillin family protein [Bacteroidaceae bacterium]